MPNNIFVMGTKEPSRPKDTKIYHNDLRSSMATNRISVANTQPLDNNYIHEPHFMYTNHQFIMRKYQYLQIHRTTIYMVCSTGCHNDPICLDYGFLCPENNHLTNIKLHPTKNIYVYPNILKQPQHKTSDESMARIEYLSNEPSDNQ